MYFKAGSRFKKIFSLNKKKVSDNEKNSGSKFIIQSKNNKELF